MAIHFTFAPNPAGDGGCSNELQHFEVACCMLWSVTMMYLFNTWL